MEALLPALAQLGFGGLMAGCVALFHYHTIKVTIPGIIDDFREELAAERQQHNTHVLALLGKLGEVEKHLSSWTVRRPRPPAQTGRSSQTAPETPK